MDKVKRFKWTVEFEVDSTWVADGFELTDERALEMLSTALPFAHIDAELGAKVIKAPNQSAVLKMQGCEEEAKAELKGA